MSALVDTLLDSARARAMPARALALELALPLAHVQTTMAQLLARLYPGARDMPSPAETFDQMIARHGRASAAGSLTGPSRALMPAGWCGEAGATIYQAPSLPPGMAYRILVNAGDNPSKITYQMTGLTGLSEVRKLLDANPDKPKTGTPGTWSYNFQSLMPGEKIFIPAAWNYLMGTDGTSLYKPTTPGVPYPKGPTTTPSADPTTPASVYTATLPAGAIQATKVKLGTFHAGEKTGILYPGPFDLNDTIDEPFRASVRRFQAWGASKGLTLPQDGGLDPVTHAAILAYVPGKVPGTDVKPPIPGTEIPDVKTPKLPPLPDTFNPDQFQLAGQTSDSGSGTGALLLLALAGFFLMAKGR